MNAEQLRTMLLEEIPAFVKTRLEAEWEGALDPQHVLSLPGDEVTNLFKQFDLMVVQKNMVDPPDGDEEMDED